jgi:hypothetical protein
MRYTKEKRTEIFNEYIKNIDNVIYYKSIPNPLRIIGEKTIIYALNTDGNIYECAIDTEDLDLLDTKHIIRCFQRPEDYTPYCKIRCEKNGKDMYIHRLVMNCPENKIIDHIDRNGTNNCKSNLIITDHKQNMLNKRVAKNNVLGIKNISMSNGKYVLNFTRQFDTLEMAIEVREYFSNEVLRIEYGEYLNKKNN